MRALCSVHLWIASVCLFKTRPMAGKDECGGQQVVSWSQTERVWFCKTRQRARSAMAIFAVFLFTRWGIAVRHSRRSKHAIITTRLRCWLVLSRVGTRVPAASRGATPSCSIST